jgi:hypothetical protein
VDEVSQSLQDMKLVPQEVLQERLEIIKQLEENDTEVYEVMKDRLTGEHYLHYCYLQINVAEGGIQEVFNHLLPLKNDDVLGIILGERNYSYPDSWSSAFLRNGPLGQYVWFDPTITDEYDKNMKISNQLTEKLKEFKKEGSLDEDSLRKLFYDMDQMWKDK